MNQLGVSLKSITEEGQYESTFHSDSNGFALAKIKFFVLDDAVVRWIETFLFGRVARLR